jgi:hypothetical protein
MKKIVRLRVVGRVTYYLGSSLGPVAISLDSNIAGFHVTQRHLLEGSVLLLMICVASELRVITSELRRNTRVSNLPVSTSSLKQAA